MKIGFFLVLIIGLSNCSLNNNANFWTETNKVTKNKNQILMKKIEQKSSNIMSLTEEEFRIFLEDYAKKSNYPDISK